MQVHKLDTRGKDLRCHSSTSPFPSMPDLIKKPPPEELPKIPGVVELSRRYGLVSPVRTRGHWETIQVGPFPFSSTGPSH